MNTTTLAPVPVDHATLSAFVAYAQGLVDTHRNEKFPNLARTILTVEPGRKYARIVAASNDSGRSVYCFVDMTNGDLLKSASWKAPAKHARGSIHDLASCALGPYGAAYLT